MSNVVKTISERLLPLAAGLAGAGILLIIVAESLHWHWAKLFSAGLISIGGIGLGIEAARSAPRFAEITAKIKSLQAPISYYLIAFTTLPVIAVLLAGFIGMFGDNGDAGTGVLVVGALLTLFMTVASLMAIALTVKAVGRAFKPAPVDESADHSGEAKS
jgi:hypothetical protein